MKLKKALKGAGYLLVLGLVYWLVIMPMIDGLNRFAPSELIAEVAGMAILFVPVILAINGAYWLDTLFVENPGWYSSYHWQRRRLPACEECSLESHAPEEITCRTVLVEKWGLEGYGRRPIYARKLSCSNGHSWKGR